VSWFNDEYPIPRALSPWLVPLHQDLRFASSSTACSYSLINSAYPPHENLANQVDEVFA
jgi:hypothetical protein